MIILLENLKSNREFLEKGKKFKFHYYLIESPLKINYNFKIGNLSYLFQIEYINDQNDHDENVTRALEDLNKIIEKITQIFIFLE